MKRILCIWLPNWPIQRLVAARPELRGRAIVLHGPSPRRGQLVVTCSPAATARNVRPGMPLAEAVALVQQAVSGEIAQSPGGTKTRPANRNLPATMDTSPLYVEPHDPQADRQALEQLATDCERFSPRVGLENAPQPHCLLLDVTGLEPVLGDEPTLGGHVLQAFDQRGYRVQVAIADTVGSAWAVAHFAGVRTRTVRQLLWVIPPGRHVQALRPLPIEALRLPDSTIQPLHLLGVLTIGQLAALPRSSWSSRFGPSLPRQWDRATGAEQEMIVAHRPPLPLHVEWTLEHPTIQRQVIERGLANLTSQLAQRLVRRNRGALQLACQLDCVHGRMARLEVGLFRATATAKHLYQLISMQLDQLALPGPLHCIRLRAITTAPLADQQHSLWNDSTRDIARELVQLIDRLSSRLGRHNVVTPRLQPDAQAEYAYDYVPLTGQPLPRLPPAPPAAPQGATGPGPRPLQLYVPPLAVDVVAVAPFGPPASFVCRHQQYRVARHWGPERIETGWWRGQSVRRDYYRVEDQQGRRFWLFRSLTDGKWFLQGSFE